MKLFKVTIEFNQDLKKEEIESIVSENFYEEDIVSEVGHKIIILWPIPEEEGEYEIENDLFYILKDDTQGTYSCELFNLEK